MSFSTGMGAKLGINGTFECKDKDGNVLETITLNGAIPLEKLGLTVEEAQQLIKETNHGSDDC